MESIQDIKQEIIDPDYHNGRENTEFNGISQIILKNHIDHLNSVVKKEDKHFDIGNKEGGERIYELSSLSYTDQTLYISSSDTSAKVNDLPLVNGKNQPEPMTKAKTLSNARDISTVYGKNPLESSENLEVFSDEYKVSINEVKSRRAHLKYDGIGDEINKVGEDKGIVMQTVKKEILELDDEELLIQKNSTTIGVVIPKENKQLQCVDQRNESNLNVSDGRAEFTETKEVNNDLIKFEEVQIKSEPEVCDDRNINGSENFDDSDTVENDTVKGVSTKSNPQVCCVCNTQFSTLRGLRCHERKHVREQQKRSFPCKFCGKEFRQNNMLKYHEVTHTKEHPFSCKSCEKTFQWQYQLTQHERFHTNDRPFECKLCDKRFIRKNNLMQHELAHSTQLPPYKCTVCGKRFVRNENLTQHKSIHTNERPFVCTVCDRRFRQKRCLDVHVLTHSGERPYACSFCEKSFFMKFKLKQHELHHVTERPHMCDVCGKTYRYKNALVKHMRSHPDEKSRNT